MQCNVSPYLPLEVGAANVYQQLFVHLTQMVIYPALVGKDDLYNFIIYLSDTHWLNSLKKLDYNLPYIGPTPTWL